MQIRTLFVIAGCFLLTVSVCIAADTATPKTPSAILPVDSFDFKAVVEGTEVVNDFIILNKGPIPLNVLRVQTT